MFRIFNFPKSPLRGDLEGLSSLPLGGRAGDGACVFNSKLLLFGEYGLMFGAKALSVPFDRFSGFLDFDTNRSHLASSAEIRKFFEHLKTDADSQKLHFTFDLESLKKDLEKGLYFNSNIPQQYGVGSSGALVAALFSRYAAAFVPEKELTPELLKVDFSMLESYFHGKSSGIDPLISFLNCPLLIDSKKMIHHAKINLAETELSFALIDTGTTGATGPLVQHFIGQLNFPEFKLAFDKQFIPANNGCIESLLSGSHQNFFLFLEQLIHFQLLHFRRMIPGNFQSVISEALTEKVFIKLLGSGGGGFLLAISETKNGLKNWAEKNQIELLMVN
ncbi:MAG: mevalonate kinase [Bacteroidota bacterium]|nr:mevalonate kinase [Bacteroidota bacterium]